MSRRRSISRLTNQPARWVTYDEPAHYDGTAALEPEVPSLPWFYATPMPEPWDRFLWHQWLSAWADDTLDACKTAWRRYGAKYYRSHRDSELKADLEDWLIVKGLEAAADFQPDPSHPNPQRQWLAFLWGFFDTVAPHHFGEVVGDGTYGPGQAAREAHRAGIPRLSELEADEAEGFRPIGRRALHGTAIEMGDPEAVVIRIEDLNRQVTKIEREDRRQGFYQSTSATCLINLCTRPAAARGLCNTHYNAERREAQARGDWQTHRAAEGCSVDGCEGEHRAGGMCAAHYAEHRVANNPPCSVDGCEKHAHSKGLCTKHYRQAREATLGTCSSPGCEKRQKTAGLCSMHYARGPRARRAEGDAQ